MHDFTIVNASTDNDTGQALYAISMVIGTNDQSQLDTSDTSCKPPASGSGNQDYCAVNQFDIVVRAGNKLGGN